jgi:hypothetical protein
MGSKCISGYGDDYMLFWIEMYVFEMFKRSSSSFVRKYLIPEMIAERKGEI